MGLLLEKDYKILTDSGLDYEEDETNRFLIINEYPLKEGLYSHDDVVLEHADILVIIPANYNSSGINMFWTYPELKRADGIAIPATFGFGGKDPRNYNGKEFCRWSRHWVPSSWASKKDNVQKILGRIEWALKKPDAVK